MRASHHEYYEQWSSTGFGKVPRVHSYMRMHMPACMVLQEALATADMLATLQKVASEKEEGLKAGALKLEQAEAKAVRLDRQTVALQAELHGLQVGPHGDGADHPPSGPSSTRKQRDYPHCPPRRLQRKSGRSVRMSSCCSCSMLQTPRVPLRRSRKSCSRRWRQPVPKQSGIASGRMQHATNCTQRGKRLRRHAWRPRHTQRTHI